LFLDCPPKEFISAPAVENSLDVMTLCFLEEWLPTLWRCITLPNIVKKYLKKN
jgi:hypothetical protein